MKKLTLKTIDNTIEHEFVFAHVFAVDYDKKIKKNEFHCPGAARLIVKTNNELFQYILIYPLIESDEKGNVNINVAGVMKNITREEKYFEPEVRKEKAILEKIYKEKSKLGLSVPEILEYEEAKIASILEKVLKIKIPYEIGGGF